GGTIADVAVATLLCMGVVLPHSMGMGGGFLATVYTRKTRKAQTLIAREKAPAAASKDMFVSNPKLAQTGQPATAPSSYEVRKWWAKGRLCFTALQQMHILDLVRARAYAQIIGRFSDRVRQKTKQGKWRIFWNSAANDTLKEGDLVVQPDLAATLELVAKHGPDYFYEGSFAAQLVREVNANGGNMTLEDLASYQAEWHVPVNVSFKDDLTLYSVPPPGSGPVLGYIIGIMDAFRTDAKERLADDACKFAYAQRALLGDPKFVELGQLVGNLTSVEQALATRRLIDDARTFDDAVHYFGEEPFQPDHGTAHASFLSPNGDAVAVTSTVNFYFGSMVRSGGVMLNNEMDDFSVPGTSNLYGVAPSEANYAAPGKRPMSSMAPAVVVGRDGDVQLVLGGAGGAKITSGIALVSMRYLWQGNNIKEAIDFPRVHHQLLPNQVDVEANFPQ
ncbi:gamma-glutamyltranspeptidase precursor, putative, partial [Ixodes scapularis]